MIGMSATLPNLNSLAQWMGNAQTYITTHRPVPLTEYFTSQNTVFNAQLEPIRLLNTPLLDECGALCDEMVQTQHGVLVFCATKDSCSDSAVEKTFFDIL